MRPSAIASARAAAAALPAVLCTLALALSPAARASGDTPPQTTPARSALVYDTEYPYIGYSGRPRDNDIARLEDRLVRGQAKLEYRAPRGYLDSLLEQLHIDPSSQTLVFSKTSLQVYAISPATPRAIYFNDDTYVAWVQNTGLIEITTMDAALGAVFYTMNNHAEAPAHLERETLRCLSCHDTFSLTGGGVPNFLFLSAYTNEGGKVQTHAVANATTDETPIADRWGGWYVTGKDGGMLHLGNIQPSATAQPVRLDQLRHGSLDTLSGLFDTQPYMTDKSDIVALLVLDHQVYLHNLIIRANYKSRMLLEKEARGSSSAETAWDQLSPAMRKAFGALLEPLVRAMLFDHAAKLTAPISGDSRFSAHFQSQGPHDPHGRSLRDLDLQTRLFKYPLSFLIYTEGFDHLPRGAKDYVYGRLAEILSGRDNSATYSYLNAQDRRAVLEILTATKPEFARAATRTVMVH
jgi:hypothetical protein